MKHLLTVLTRYIHPHSSVSFWHTKIAPVYYNYSTLSDYYIDSSAKTGYSGPYDSFGIPLLNYLGRVGKQYNPCAIAQWGLGAFQKWKRSGVTDYYSIFVRAADWLRNNIEINDQGHGYWKYRFNCDAYNLQAPWVSALAQAQGISLLLRAYLATEDKSYLQCAKQACSAMLSPVSDGGLLLHYEGKYTILEEAIADRATAILDGLIFAIFGLQDYCFVVKNDIEAKSILIDSISAIADLLPRYDLGYWSRADLYSENPPMPASAFYHGLHVAQLNVLADLTGVVSFNQFAEKWNKLSCSFLNRWRAYLMKIKFKIFFY